MTAIRDMDMYGGSSRFEAHSTLAPLLSRTFRPEHLLFESDDLDETRTLVADVFCPHTLIQKNPRGRLNAFQYLATANAVSLSYMGYGADVLVDPGCLESFFLVQMPLEGQAEISIGSRSFMTGTRTASIQAPTESLKMRWSEDCRKLVVRIDRRALELQLSHLLGRSLSEPLVFDPVLDMTSANGRVWWQQVMAALEAMPHTAGLPCGGLLGAQLDHGLMTSLLFLQPNNYWPQLRARMAPAVPRHVRLAEEYIRAHPDEDIGMEKLAALCGTSPRTLYAAFKLHRGVSPMQMLRDIRLERARDDLLRQTEQTTSVTDTALRWGFTHLGRFAVSYKKRFGESPYQTLRR